jgi:hypothetical protein
MKVLINRCEANKKTIARRKIQIVAMVFWCNWSFQTVVAMTKKFASLITAGRVDQWLLAKTPIFLSIPEICFDNQSTTI